MAQAPVLERNPLRDGLVLARTPDPCAMVIFGATGDLTHRKLMPALYNLALNHYLPQGFTVVGAAHSALSDDEFRSQMRDAVGKYSRTQPIDSEVWRSFSEGLHYVSMAFEDPSGYARISSVLQDVDRTRGTGGNRAFYMATLPGVFTTVVRSLGTAGLAQTAGWTRVVIEKPFGHDLASARALNTAVHEVFKEPQVYRIDHYLGKETVQNVMVFRFANGIFEPIWNRRYVDHMQITVAEDIGIEQRGAYYEQTGALRDIAQNHLLQLLSIT
ncbi:MAG TPA: glucose-6-phosphate dehydrogenase, partial [Candidatus Dormibacteraeota bacterium]|nr:glucose-6-phosphate dehydrogenase [Candidatus Dormibacteraeota bacterium]